MSWPLLNLVDVDHAVCADSVLLHEPEAFQEQSTRDGVLNRKAVEIHDARGGLLAAQPHATQEPLDPGSSRVRHPLRRAIRAPSL